MAGKPRRRPVRDLRAAAADSQINHARSEVWAIDPDIRRLETRISEKLGAAVKIKSGKQGAGKLIVSFHSSDELDGILQHLSL